MAHSTDEIFQVQHHHDFMLPSTSHELALERRKALRKHLLAQREQFAASVQAVDATTALARHLGAVLRNLEPGSIGLYWPMRSEFNAAAVIAADPTLAKLPIALPFAQRAPVRMHFRAWNGATPTTLDECGIAGSDGAPIVPDVVVVPCVGFTVEGLRLGYGGGYFDRWLAQQPGVTAVGVAWSMAEIDAAIYEAQPHDRPLTLIVTERGVM
jgi:5-formyltetrahydrofolate cyclo-ligase